MAYVMARSVAQGSAAGVASAVGLAIGGVLLALVAVSGLAALFQTSSVVYSIVAFIGGLYLVYLGVRIIRTMRVEPVSDQVERKPYVQIVYQGILVELLNPKTILFFVAFLPPFVDPTLGSVTTQMLVLGMLVPLTAIPSDLLVSFASGTLTNRIKSSPSTRAWLRWLSGIVLILIGLSVFLDGPAIKLIHS